MSKQQIAIIDASTATLSIHDLPKHLHGAQIEEVEEYYEINGNSDFIFGELTIQDFRKNKQKEICSCGQNNGIHNSIMGEICNDCMKPIHP